MKKIYQKPEVEIVVAEMMEMVAATQDVILDTTRNVSQESDVAGWGALPIPVDETTETESGLGWGQGGQGTTRSKEGNLWDD